MGFTGSSVTNTSFSSSQAALIVPVNASTTVSGAVTALSVNIGGLSANSTQFYLSLTDLNSGHSISTLGGTTASQSPTWVTLLFPPSQAAFPILPAHSYLLTVLPTVSTAPAHTYSAW